MKVQRPVSRLAGHKIFKIYQESVIYQCVGWVRLRGKYPFDDRVKDLRGRPLGMFFYNQRAIFFFVALTSLAMLSLLVVALPHTPKMLRTVGFLSVCWVVGALLTVSLHPLFKKKLKNWAPSAEPVEYPPMFDLYFLFDWILVFALVVIGKRYDLNVEAFTFLLFANTIVYSSYIRDSRNLARTLAVLISLLIIAYLLYPGIGVANSEPRWFYLILYLGPILGTLGASVALVMGISLLRSFEQQVTQSRIELLGEYENSLSGPIVATHLMVAKQIEESGKDEFESQITAVLKNMCSLGSPFWYNAACLWLLEEHEDLKEVLLLGPRTGLEVRDDHQKVEIRRWSLSLTDLTMVASLRSYVEDNKIVEPAFRADQDIPAAFIPISNGNTTIGVLALYGSVAGPPLQRQETAFLNSLGSIVSNAREQWQARTNARAQMEMDNLFKLEKLDHVFSQAAKIMKKYLMAAGCMVIFRRDPDGVDMEVKACEGFTDSILRYSVGEGLTGKCAEIGETIRCDDVLAHEDRFDPDLLQKLRDAHQAAIISWMAIPIGPAIRNYGVIKVVNRTSRCSWFTKEDERLGQSLAFALRIIVEKFLHVEMLAKATAEATRQSIEAKLKSEEATAQKKRAEETAARRQQDLMVITHQIQAPLSSVIGALSSLQSRGVPPYIKSILDYVRALVEDGLILCYGTTTSFAIAAGKKTHFDIKEIDAPSELKKLCDRLQLTNARHDLNFAYHKDVGFPTLQMDRDVFTSVMYSLIHNAMKYSDQFSQVSMMCKFIEDKPVLEISSLGEPILPDEANDIFKRFTRGRVVEETGRHHRGVGLGLWASRKLMREIGGDLTVILPRRHPRLSIFVVHFPPATTSSS